MSVFSWEESAAQFTRVADSRRSIVFPFVRSRLVALKPREVLDYGGGDGEFAALCASEKSLRITMFDPSLTMRELARQRLQRVPGVKIEADRAGLPANHFNVVVQIAVWMSLTTEAECLQVLGDASRVMAPGGRLIAAVTHPCFRTKRYSTFSTDFREDDYLNDGTQFTATLFDGQNTVELRDTHWSLGAMSRQLHAAGLAIDELAELPDKPQAPGVPWLIILARKCVSSR